MDLYPDKCPFLFQVKPVVDRAHGYGLLAASLVLALLGELIFRRMRSDMETSWHLSTRPPERLSNDPLRTLFRDVPIEIKIGLIWTPGQEVLCKICSDFF